MAVLSGITTCNMRRVLAGGGDAVMAGIAGSNDLRVINGHHRREHIRGVAVFTEIRRLNVCRVFAGSICAIVAPNTISADVQMIEIRRQPASRAVTIIAGNRYC